MLTEYETGFTILQQSDLKGPALLTSVADKLESSLSDGRDDGSLQITEREVSASSGYAIVGADCSHPLDPEHAVRIQARLCTEGQEVTAQIRTRFLSTDDNDPTELTAGPPPVLQEIVNNYHCEIGTYQFRNEVFQVDNIFTARHVMRFITNPSRKIPVLILTEDDKEHTAIEPKTALEYLLGLALVVRFKGDTSSHIRAATGQACYNGAMRFYWPGDSASKFYWPRDAASISITQFQKDCIDNAEIHDLNGDFEQIFSTARTTVIREQRHEAHSQTAEALKRADDKIHELERLLENAKSTAGAVQDSEKDKELRKQTTIINQLRRIRRIDEDKIRELTLKNRELAESLEHLTTESGTTKIAKDMELTSGSALELTGKAGIDNITILNHAINIYRDPVRRYIINGLRKFYDDNELCTIIERTMKDETERRRLRGALGNNRPQDGIDIGHFEHIVMDSRTCFGENHRLTTRLADVRQVRNAAAHPGSHGIDTLKAKDGIKKVARALREMDNNDDSKRVEKLLPFVR